MDSMLRLRRDKLRQPAPLADRLRQKRERWLVGVRARQSRSGLACVNAAQRFAGSHLRNRLRLSARRWDEAPYAWDAPGREYLRLPGGRWGVARDTDGGLPPDIAFPSRVRSAGPMPPEESSPPSVFGRSILTRHLLMRPAEHSTSAWPWLRVMAGSPVGSSGPGVSSTRGRRDSQSQYRPMRLSRPEREQPLGRESGLASLALRPVSRVNLEPPAHTGFEATSPWRERERSPQTRQIGPSPLALQPASGLPLEPPLRANLERLMGFDLGTVRLHTDSTAASWAFRLQAHAFTVGHHVFFGAGRFRPQTRTGLGLLVHELSHVRQQPGGAPLQWGQVTLMQYKRLEEEAHMQAHAALTGMPLASQRGSPGAFFPLGQPAQGFSAPGGVSFEVPGQAMPLPSGSGAFPPLVLSYGSRTTTVVPLRQESTVNTGEAPTPGAETRAAVAPVTHPPEAPDPERLAQKVYEWIQRRLRIEAERKGVQRWH